MVVLMIWLYTGFTVRFNVTVESQPCMVWNVTGYDPAVV